jgi:uncharacterized repeat protein (TIGR01451 family)
MTKLRQGLFHGLVLVWCVSAQAATFTVTTTNDSGAGSLRQAILDANARPGPDAIHFAIPGAGLHTISPATFLPDITDPVVLDGYTQIGARANTLATGSDAVLRVCLHEPTNDLGTAGLRIATSNSVVRGLAISGFALSWAPGRFSGIDILEGSGHRVEGCFLGLKVDGTQADPLSFGVGVHLGSNTAHNVIGGPTPAERNVIGGVYYGIWIEGPENTVTGNFIGIDPAGQSPRTNGTGVAIRGAAARNNVVGGRLATERNVISGNGIIGSDRLSAGIFIEDAPGNAILGNLIGTDATGQRAVSNQFAGILLRGLAASNQIGGVLPGSGNLISGNDSGVILFGGQGTPGIVIQGNLIGTDATGTNRIGNRTEGISSDSSLPLLIGGSSARAGNVISGNGSTGVMLSSPGHYSSVVQGNFIGTDRTGALNLGNGGNGIWLISPDNTVGGRDVGEGNVIAFNRENGIDRGGDRRAIILGNSIHSNGGLGIDSGTSSHDNDPGDVLEPQNHPELLSVLIGSLTTTIQGQLSTRSDSVCRIEFFDNDVCDATGRGEGQRYLGFLDVATGPDGLASFTYLHPARLDPTHVITASATRADAGTSGFSACVEVRDTAAADLTVTQRTDLDFVAVGSDVTFLITVHNGGPSPARGVTVVNPVPPRANLVAVSASQGACVQQDGVVRCAMGTLAEDATAQMELTLQTSTRGPLTNTATATSSEIDHRLSDNVSSFGIEVGLADLHVDLHASADLVYVGQLVTNTIVVTNAGPDTAFGVHLYLNAGSDLVEINSHCDNCNRLGFGFSWPQVEGGSFREASVIYRPVREGTFLVEAYLSSATPDPPDPAAQIGVTVEEGPGLIEFDSEHLHLIVREDAGVATLRLVRAGGAQGQVAVRYTVIPGTATAGSDFLPPVGEVTFADGEPETTIEVALIPDEIPECAEDFVVRLLRATGGANLHFATNAVVSILNSDSQPAGLVSPVAVSYREPGALVEAASPSVSADGRYIAFVSPADDVSPGFDTESHSGNVFVRDLREETTLLASPAHGEINAGAGDCYDARLSSNGRFVVFNSYSPYLVENGPDAGQQNVYLRDLVARQTYLVSANSDNTGGAAGYAYGGGVSTNGAIVVFPAVATNLVPQPVSAAYQQFYARNVTNRSTSLVSISYDGKSGGDGDSSGGSLTPDGRFMVFASEAGNLVPNDTNHVSDVFVRDLVAQTTTLVSVDQSGQAGGGSLPFVDARFISNDGRYVVFESHSTNLAPDTPTGLFGKRNIFLRDMAAGVTRCVSVLPHDLVGYYWDCLQPALTPDGRFVAFMAESRWSGQPWEYGYDVFVRDLLTSTTILATTTCDGTAPAAGLVYAFHISDDGRYVVFQHASPGPGLTPGEWAEFPEIHLYRRDLQAGITTLLSQNRFLTGPANAGIESSWFSADGKTAAFVSGANDLVENRGEDVWSVFVWREGLPAKLSITITDDLIRLSWLRALSGYQLESAASLGPGATWKLVDDPVSAAGAFNEVTVSRVAAGQFFRLRTAP